MTASLVVTVIGRDKPGLVNALSEKVAAFGGSWLESRMARLAGEFAGIVLVEVPEANVDGLTAALRDLEASGLRTTVERSAGSPPRGSYKTLKLDLIALDRPGIVRDITNALAQQCVNIEEFTSGTGSASFSGEQLFKATARLRVLDNMAIDNLRRTLERLANEMMVDITLDNEGEREI
jgi:glycine cleavage system regulatory protein